MEGKSADPQGKYIISLNKLAIDRVADFIKNPEHKYKEAYVKGMIDYFNLKMPNQHMSDEEIKDIIEYFKWIDENANLF